MMFSSVIGWGVDIASNVSKISSSLFAAMETLCAVARH